MNLLGHPRPQSIAADHHLRRSVLVNRERRAITSMQATKGRRSLVDRERPPIIAPSGPCMARIASDRLLRRKSRYLMEPAVIQVSGGIGCA